MTTDTDYAWTRNPAEAAVERQRWPAKVSRFDTERDDVAEFKDKPPWQFDDPRPLRGYVLLSAGCTDDRTDCPHPVHRRYTCVQCGLGKTIGCTHTTPGRFKQIKYACQACRDVVRHNPAGATSRSLVLLGEEDPR